MVQVSKYKEKPEPFYIDKIFQKIQVIWWKLHNFKTTCPVKCSNIVIPSDSLVS